MLCAKIIEIGSSMLNLSKIKLVTFLRHAVERCDLVQPLHSRWSVGHSTLCSAASSVFF